MSGRELGCKSLRNNRLSKALCSGLWRSVASDSHIAAMNIHTTWSSLKNRQIWTARVLSHTSRICRFHLVYIRQEHDQCSLEIPNWLLYSAPQIRHDGPCRPSKLAWEDAGTWKHGYEFTCYQRDMRWGSFYSKKPIWCTENPLAICQKPWSESQTVLTRALFKIFPPKGGMANLNQFHTRRKFVRWSDATRTNRGIGPGAYWLPKMVLSSGAMKCPRGRMAQTSTWYKARSSDRDIKLSELITHWQSENIRLSQDRIMLASPNDLSVSRAFVVIEADDWVPNFLGDSGDCFIGCTYS